MCCQSSGVSMHLRKASAVQTKTADALKHAAECKEVHPMVNTHPMHAAFTSGQVVLRFWDAAGSIHAPNKSNTSVPSFMLAIDAWHIAHREIMGAGGLNTRRDLLYTGTAGGSLKCCPFRIPHGSS